MMMMMMMMIMMTMTATKLNVCWLIGMRVSGFPARTIHGYFRNLQFCKWGCMMLHVRCKLLVSDNILSTHVRPRQRSDVCSIRLCLPPIPSSSCPFSEHLRKYSTTGCILVKTWQGNWTLAKQRIRVLSLWDYDTSPHKTKKSWRSITNHFNPSRSNSLKKSSHCQTKQDWRLRPKTISHSHDTFQHMSTAANIRKSGTRVCNLQRCAHDILKPALHFPSHSSSDTAAKLLLSRGQCWQRIDVHQLEQMEYPILMHEACDVEIVSHSLTCKLQMTWTKGTEKEHACIFVLPSDLRRSEKPLGHRT